MKIIINTSTNVLGGGLQISISLLYELIKYSNHEFYVFMNYKLCNCLDFDKFSSNFHFYKIPKLKKYQYNNYLSRLENSINPNVVFSVFGPTYWRPKVTHVMGFAMGHYIYPDSPFWKTISVKEKIFWMFKKKIQLYYFNRDADIFIVETQDASKRLQNLLHKPCYVVSNTYNSFFDQFLNQNRKVLYRNNFLPTANGEFRFLSVCTPYKHKNLSIIPTVIDELEKRTNKRIVFILTISQEDYSKIFPPKYRNSIITVGTVSSNELPQLYSECDYVIVPSLLECFTANFPEGMIMKKPILAADLGYAHTICNDAAIYFNPLNASDIADKIVRLINDKELQNQLIDLGLKQIKKFKNASQRTKLYIEILEKNNNYDRI